MTLSFRCSFCGRSRNLCAAMGASVCDRVHRMMVDAIVAWGLAVKETRENPREKTCTLQSSRPSPIDA